MQKTQTTATSSPIAAPSEILTIDELGGWLKCGRRSIYEMTRIRSQLHHEIPLPVLRLPFGIRFRRSDIEEWLQRHAEARHGR